MSLSMGQCARQSFYPAWVLARQRNIDPLMMKYRDSPACRLRHLRDHRPVGEDYKAGSPLTYEPFKWIGLFAIAANEPSIAAGWDPKSDTVIQWNGKDTIGLHLDFAPLKGLEQIRGDLAKVALYFGLPEFNHKTYVAGVTYPEIARLAVGFGFRRIDLDHINNRLAANIEAAHRVSCRLRNRPPTAFAPEMVYLPRTEFIETFGAPLAADRLMPTE